MPQLNTKIMLYRIRKLKSSGNSQINQTIIKFIFINKKANKIN